MLIQASYSTAPTCLPRWHYFLFLEFTYHCPELYLVFPDYKQDAAPTGYPGDAVLLLQGHYRHPYRPDVYGLYELYRASYRPGRRHV